MSQTRAHAAFAADRPLIPYPFERMDGATCATAS